MIGVVALVARSQAFEAEGYKLPMPLIPIQGEPMFAVAARSLPAMERTVVVAPTDFERRFSITAMAQRYLPGCEVLLVDRPTDTPLRMSLAAARWMNDGVGLLVSTGDFHLVATPGAFEAHMADPAVDVVAWTFQMRSTVKKDPQSLAFCRIESGAITELSIRAPISETPQLDPALVGAFAFRDGALFRDMASRVASEGGDEEIDYATCVQALIEAGRRVVPLPAQTFVPFHDPFDLQLFHAWEEYFHAESTHPYGEIPRESP
jgi:hypothetical protein